MPELTYLEIRESKSVLLIYGIGLVTSKDILAKQEYIRVRDLTEEDAGNRKVIETEHIGEGDLRREVSLTIKRLMEIGSSRGIAWKRSQLGVRKTTQTQELVSGPAVLPARKK